MGGGEGDCEGVRALEDADGDGGVGGVARLHYCRHIYNLTIRLRLPHLGIPALSNLLRISANWS
jgi:hypothetical protein